MATAVQYAAAMLLLPIIVGAAIAGYRLTAPGHSAVPPDYAGALPARPAHDAEKKTVVIVSSVHGAEITDFLPPYEILASSGEYNTYALAPGRTVIPLVNANLAATSLDFIPHYSFAEYDATIGVTPDLIAIPWFPNYTPERDAAVLEWVRANTGPHTILLSICAGTEILADTGLLDGRIATTHTRWFARLEPRFPATTWLRDVRYMDDGVAITSANLAAGIDASLRAVERLSDRSVAESVAGRLGYAHTQYLDDPGFQPPDRRDALVRFAAAAQWRQQQIGVLAFDGVGEMALAGILDLYSSSSLAKPTVIGIEPSAVMSRNGLTLVPRFDTRTAGKMDRVVLPHGEPRAGRDISERWATHRPDSRVEAIHDAVGSGGSSYDATLRDIARQHDAATARAIGAAMFYPVDGLELPGFALPIRALVMPLALMMFGAMITFGVRRLLARK